MERKGQHLFNAIAKKRLLLHHKCEGDESGNIFPYYNLHQILFYMTDQEFDEIMEEIKHEVAS